MRMEEAVLFNQTTLVMYFRLRDLSANQNVQMASFAMFLIFYVLTLIGNILIVITVDSILPCISFSATYPLLMSAIPPSLSPRC